MKVRNSGLMILLIGLFLLPGCSLHKTEITKLQINYQEKPLVVDDGDIVFSWQMHSEEKNKRQTAYRIRLWKDEEQAKNNEYVWDSGKVEDDSSIAIRYVGDPLCPETQYYWNVEVWDEKGRKYTSSENGLVETGFMGSFPDEAHWISVPGEWKKERIHEEVKAFTIEYTMELKETSACFVFGAEEGRYGSMILCELQNCGEETNFTIKNMKDLPEKTDFDTKAVPVSEDDIYRVKLTINEDGMKAVINDGEVGDFILSAHSLGAIGYYKSRGTNYAYLDDILVKDEVGNTIYEENFSKEKTIFSPYHLTMEKERCRMGSGLLLSDQVDDPAPVFRRSFQVENRDIEKARLYMTSLGCFDVRLNGKRVTDTFMDPGKLAYHQQLSYVTYDVTEHLQAGTEHVWDTTLLHGWYDRGVGYPEIYNPWGEKNAFRGVLVITYQNGQKEFIGTDETFDVTMEGPLRENDVYHGEFYDAIAEKKLERSNGNDAVWMSAAMDEVDSIYQEIPLTAKENEPMICIEELQPVSVSEPVEGSYVFDFGQNFAGVCRIRMTAEEGDLITLRYGEAINTESLQNQDDVIGTIWTENLLTAEATDYYIAVEGEQVYEPVSVYHGFRYLQIAGLSKKPQLEDVTGVVLSSDLTETGFFECSDELVNQYWSNAVWSQKSNFMDNPTDCAQRDERHGWAGDAQIFSGVACYNSNVYNFYRKYLTELRSLQDENGSFPDMAPRNFGTMQDGRGGAGGNNCWGDAAIVIAWNLYTQYGDIRILEENYDAFCKWVDYLESHSENGLRVDGQGYGDHFSMEGTPSGLTDTAWSAHSAALLAKISVRLGEKEKASYYEQLFDSFRKAWLAEYVSADGVIECYSQTAYALGLSFDLFSEELRERSAENLLNNLTFNQYEFHAGYAGLNYLLPSLSEAGYSEAAYQVLCNTRIRSLLYPVTLGATTTPEYLLGYQEADGHLKLDGSLNHYAYGAPTKWLYTNVLGIQSDENVPGFKHFFINPEVNGEWIYAKGHYDSPYGTIKVSWEQQENGSYCYQITIPANTSATVHLPGMEQMELGSGEYRFVI